MKGGRAAALPVGPGIASFVTVLRRLVAVAMIVVTALATLLPAGAKAQAPSWPVRPVRLILPAPPGGGTDAVARTLAQKLSDAFGQPFIVENKPGGSGVIGAALVAKAPPDGYMLMISASVHLINALIMKQVPYDAVADFAPITQIAEVPLIVTVHPASGINDIRDLMTRRDVPLNWAIAAIGSPDHLVAESFRSVLGAPLTIVPYKGMGPAISDTLGGQVAGMSTPILSLISHVRDGRLRAIAVTSLKRNVGVPSVPTLAETVMPGFTMSSWYGLWGPRGLPGPLAAQIAAAARKGFLEPDIKVRFPPEGFEVIGSGPEEFSRLIDVEVTRYGKIIRDAKISADQL